MSKEKTSTDNQSYVQIEKMFEAKKIRNFIMIRKTDESGVSGTGAVLHGSMFWNGKVSVCWITDKSSVAVYESFEDFKAIHIDSHPTNGTEVIWLSEQPSGFTEIHRMLMGQVWTEKEANKLIDLVKIGVRPNE